VPKVLIVGAGPTGLTLACELARHGVASRLIDRRAVHVDRTRAADVQPRTLEIFHDLGIADGVMARGRPITAMTIYDSPKRLARLAYAADGSRYPFAVALPQTETEEILEQRLRELGGEVERGVRLRTLAQTGDKVTVTMTGPDGDSEAADYDWVVGCDGAASTVRHELDIEFDARGNNRGFVTCDVTTDLNLPSGDISLFLSEHGYLMVLPLPPDHRVRLIADTEPPTARPDSIAALEALAEKQLGASVVFRDTGMVATYHVQHRLASAFQIGRVFLAGDAAHTFNPVGGHGMNQGVQDAHNLGWKLALVVRGIASPELLGTYASERRNAARIFTREMDFTARLKLSYLAAESEEYDRLMDFAVMAPPLRRSVLDAALQPQNSYRTGAFVRDVVASGFESPSGVTAGTRAPDVSFGDHGRLHDLLRGPEHTLLLFGGAKASPSAAPAPPSLVGLANEVQKGWPELVKVYVVVTGDGPVDGWPGEAVRDASGTLHSRYGADLPCGYLVRPDGHIGFRCLPLSAGALRDHLTTIFTPGFAAP
jgi:2-polyprenyl-6-methoxyphenol hydroxylase-like FAD-dependent oxidoreductase